MAIEINRMNYSQTQSANDGKPVEVARGENTQAQDETGTPLTNDTVSLTDTASRLRSLENTLSSLPVVDPQRVEQYRDAILNGSYKVDAQQVADKLLQFDDQLKV